MSKLAGLRGRAVVAELIRRMQDAGSWSGETHVQKSMYLVNSLLGVPMEYEFVLHRYGPYSFDLHDDLIDMAAAGLLEMESHPPYGPSLKPTERAAKVIARFPRTMKRYEKELSFVADSLGEENVNSLERLATALYVTKKSDHPNDVETRARDLRTLKPHVALEDARQAVKRIDQLAEDARQFRLE